MAKDYYKILGVTEEADQLEIKKAYRQKALELHPDVNPSEEAVILFQQVKEAYEVLGDKDAKTHYDSGTVIIDFSDFEEPRQYTYAAAEPKPTNFSDYSKQSTIACIIALVFSLTFLFDLTVMHDLGEVEVTFTKMLDASGYEANVFHVYVETEAGNFETQTEGSVIYSGEILSIKKGYLYGFMRYKRQQDQNYHLTNDNPAIMFVIAVLVFIAGLFGLLPLAFVSPERKFNAAIVGGFFSIALLIFLLAT